MEKLDLNKKSLSNFGVVMGFAFLVIAGIIFFKHKSNFSLAAIIALVFFVLALLLPAILRPIYIIWMRLASVLAWINTRIILAILFYLIFTPIGLVMRVFGADLLDRKIDDTKSSYWKRKERPVFNPLDYEKQF